MEYNSQKEDLIIAEYGRNIQDLVGKTRQEADPEKRQNMANAIINLMNQISPTNKNNDENKEKLWRHFFRIAKYDIDVIPPDGIIPTPENTVNVIGKIKYPENIKKHRQYGKHVRDMIAKALKLEDPETREELSKTIASYMKLAYRTWNREHFVSDDIIKNDLVSMSNGQLRIADEDSIDTTVYISTSTANYTLRKKSIKGKNNNYRQNNTSNNNNHRRRR